MKKNKLIKSKENRNRLFFLSFILWPMLLLSFLHNPLKANEPLYSEKAVWQTIFNDLNQPQLRCHLPVTDSKQLVTNFDSALRPISRQLVDRNNQPVHREEIAYDNCGNNSSQRIFYGHSETPQLEIQRFFNENLLTSVSIQEQGRPLRRLDYDYDDQGRVREIVKPDGVTLQLTYYPNGELQQIYSSDGTIDYLYTYDAMGRAILVEDRKNSHLYQREYSSQGYLIQEQILHKTSLLFSYDAQGNLLKTQLPDGSAIARDYDGGTIKRIARLDSCGTELYTHNFKDSDHLGRPLKTEMVHNLGSIEYRYNQEGQLISIKSPFQAEEYLKIEAQQIELNRIVFNEKKITEQTITYSYDNQGLLSAERQHGQNDLTHYLYDEKNIPIVEDLSITRDINGNAVELLLPNGQRLECRYDALNRLIEVISDKLKRTVYQWDGWGRRVSKRTEEWLPTAKGHEGAWVAAEELTYLFEQGKEIGAVNKEGRLAYLRLMSQGPTCADYAMAIEINGTVFCPMYDLRGNLCGIIDPSTTTITQMYEYTAFGQQQQNELNIDAYNPWGFANKWNEEESGFICFGSRFYHPALRQWLSEDPLGYLDGWQRTIYARNDPIRYTDTTGELSVSLSLEKAWKETCSLYEQASEGIGSLIKKPIDSLSKSRLGKELLTIAGYYQDEVEVGVYGNGEINDRVRISSINGILNTKEGVSESLELLSSTHGGVNIHYIFRPTTGIIGDLSDAFAIRILGQSSLYAELLATCWRQLIEEMGGVDNGGLIIHYAHSLGGADTYAASQLMTAEEKRMIRIVTIGSAKIIPQTAGFENVVNYASCNDGIPWLSDPAGYLKSLFGASSHMLQELSSTNSLPFIEHFWAQGPYRELMHVMGERFTKQFTE